MKKIQSSSEINEIISFLLQKNLTDWNKGQYFGHWLVYDMYYFFISSVSYTTSVDVRKGDFVRIDLGGKVNSVNGEIKTDITKRPR